MEKQNPSEQNHSEQNQQENLLNLLKDFVPNDANVVDHIKEESPDMNVSLSSAGSSLISEDYSKGKSPADNGQPSAIEHITPTNTCAQDLRKYGELSANRWIGNHNQAISSFGSGHFSESYHSINHSLNSFATAQRMGKSPGSLINLVKLKCQI